MLIESPSPRATSAIAAETARHYAAAGARLFLTGRHADRLEAVADDLRVRGAAAVETAVLDVREHRRCEEVVETAAATPAALYEELRTRHPFHLARSQLRVAIDGEFAAWDAPLAEGARVVFIPPVAGG